MTKYLMNSFTGSVDTAENWEAERIQWENTHDKKEPWCGKNNGLVEVERDANGQWVEVE